MSTLKNNTQLIGRAGDDPSVRTFESGKKMATVSIATNETYYNNNGEKVQDTQWHNLVAWGKKADVFEEYIKKGDEFAIQGKLINRKYEKDGITRYSTEIIVGEILLMGGNKE